MLLTNIQVIQILYEADWLADMEEKALFQDREKTDEIIGKIFKTVTGKKWQRNFITDQSVWKKIADFNFRYSNPIPSC